MGFGNGGLSAQGLFQGAMTGLAQGAASIGLNYLTEQFDIPPLLANIGFSAISLGIEGLINGSGIFGNMEEKYKKNALTFMGVNEKPAMTNDKYWLFDENGGIIPGSFQRTLFDRDMGNYYWQEAAYISQILDFSEIVQRDGLVAALNTYATGFFNAIAVNSMVSVAGSVGSYIADKLARGIYTLVSMKDGTIAKKVDIEDTGESALVGDEGGIDTLKGKMSEDEVLYGTLGKDVTNKIGLTDGYMDYLYDERFGYYMTISGMDPDLIQLSSAEGRLLMELGATEGATFDFTNEGFMFHNENFNPISTDDFHGLELLDLITTPLGYTAKYGVKITTEFAVEHGIEMLDAIFTVQKSFAETTNTLTNNIALKIGEETDKIDMSDPDTRMSFLKLLSTFKSIYSDASYVFNPDGKLPGPKIMIPKEVLEEALSLINDDPA